MKAVQISTLEGPTAVTLVDLTEPAATASEVIIDVKAVGVSFVDALMTRGLYQVRPELPFVPGSKSRELRAQPQQVLRSKPVIDAPHTFPVVGTQRWYRQSPRSPSRCPTNCHFSRAPRTR